jgi:hypothetical protein
MTTHDEPTRDEIKSSLRAQPLTAEEVMEMPEADRLGLALFFGAPEVRVLAMKALADTVREEIEAEANVIPFRPRQVDGRKYVAVGPEGLRMVDYAGLFSDLNDQPRPAFNLKETEEYWLRRAAENNTAALDLRDKLAKVEKMGRAIAEMLAEVRAFKQRQRTTRKPSPSLVNFDDGEPDGHPPLVA